MSDEFNPERARRLTVQSIDQTVMILKVNRDMCVQILQSMGAPNEASADGFLKMMTNLLNTVANSVEQSAEIVDASERLKQVQENRRRGVH
ncbi:hypothetical protein [Paraburkholderia youngii]|uniref:hypothetical protein n=1 Tax=Paraburkholderia youngii TaxID=2782701 RepID=UPI001590AB54|nr:hypothetical protein [Paraburkholderia youngii]NUX58708.1 hypothetical protein [Paraburkholderia youngii]